MFALMAAGDLCFWIWSDARVRRLPHARWWRGLIAGFVVAMLLYMAAALVLPGVSRRSAGPLPVPVHVAAYVWHLLILPALLVTAAIDGLGKGIAAIVRFLRQSSSPAKPAPRDGLTRRQLLGAAAVSAPPLAMGVLTGVGMRGLGAVRVRRFDLSFPSLPPALDGTTIAQVSDLHVGKFTRDHSLRHLADQVNALRADFVAVTGDLIDLALADLPRALNMIRRLDPHRGLVICEGNHDLIESRFGFEMQMSQSGLDFLLEAERTIPFRSEVVQFLAIPWSHSTPELSESVNRVRPMIRSEAFPILLAHHPHAFDAAARAGIPLVLSGHTHGGQIMLNERLGFGPAMFKYWSGLYQKPGSSLIVSNGAGNWFPIRMNAPAEIIHITLRRDGR